MLIRGREYKFLYTVRASIEIAKGLPGNDIREIGRILKEGNQVKSTELIGTMAIAMNRGYLMRKAAEEQTKFNPEDVLTREIYLDLTHAEEQELENEIMNAYVRGNKTEMETENSDGKKTKAPENKD